VRGFVLKERVDITGTIKAPELNSVGHRRKEKRRQRDVRGTTPKQTLIHPSSISAQNMMVSSTRGRVWGGPVQHQQNRTSCISEHQDETRRRTVSVG